MDYLQDKEWRFRSDHAPMRLELDIEKLAQDGTDRSREESKLQAQT